MTTPFSESDLIDLNAYLDNEMSEAERSKFEQRLEKDPSLQQELSSLREIVALLQKADPVQAPRAFTLDPRQYSQHRRRSLFERLGIEQFTLRPVLAGTSLVASLALFILGFITLFGGGLTGAAVPEAALMEEPAMEAAEAPMESIPEQELDASTAADTAESAPLAETEPEEEEMLSGAEAEETFSATPTAPALPTPAPRSTAVEPLEDGLGSGGAADDGAVAPPPEAQEDFAQTIQPTMIAEAIVENGQNASDDADIGARTQVDEQAIEEDKNAFDVLQQSQIRGLILMALALVLAGTGIAILVINPIP